MVPIWLFILLANEENFKTEFFLCFTAIKIAVFVEIFCSYEYKC